MSKKIKIYVLIYYSFFVSKIRRLIAKYDELHHTRFLINLEGRRRNPLHPKALRLVDVKPGISFTIYSTHDYGSHKEQIVGEPYFCFDYYDWMVETAEGTHLFLDAAGIIPETGYPSETQTEGFNGYSYSLIND